MADKGQTNRKQATQQAILEAAYQLFSQKGFKNTTTREIAACAGVNELTLFRHFQNKFNLLSNVIAAHSIMTRLEMDLEAIQQCDFQAGLYRFARLILSHLQDKYPLIRLMMMEASTNPELKAVIGPIPAELRKHLTLYLQKGVQEGFVRSDLNLELVAQDFLWIFLGAVMTRANIGAEFFPFESEAVIETTVTLFLRGLHP